MAESADWWGSINEQMRKYAGARNLPTKVADETDIPSATTAAVSSSSVSQQAPSRPSADIPKRPAAAAPQPPSAANNTSKPVAAGPLPARSHPPQPQQQPQQKQQPIPQAAAPAPMVPDYALADISPERANISKLSLAEQMELKLQAKIAGSPSAANILDVPQFDAVPMDTHEMPKPASSGNPWDTFEGDNNPGW